MFNRMRPTGGVVSLLILAFGLVVIGCGGSGGGGGSTGVTAGSTSGSTSGTTSGSTSGTTAGGNPGTLNYVIQWPTETKAIPGYAKSIVISAFAGGTTLVNKQTVNRTQSMAYSQIVPLTLSPGSYKVVGEAKDLLNGQGTTVASVTTNATVQSGQTSQSPLTFTSTVSKVFIDNLPSSATVGQTIGLTAHAADGNNNAILLPPGALQWSLLAGDEFAFVTEDGNLTIFQPGAATIQVQEKSSGVKATKTVTFIAGSNNEVVIIVS